MKKNKLSRYFLMAILLTILALTACSSTSASNAIVFITDKGEGDDVAISKDVLKEDLEDRNELLFFRLLQKQNPNDLDFKDGGQSEDEYEFENEGIYPGYVLASGMANKNFNIYKRNLVTGQEYRIAMVTAQPEYIPTDPEIKKKLKASASIPNNNEVVKKTVKGQNQTSSEDELVERVTNRVVERLTPTLEVLCARMETLTEAIAKNIGTDTKKKKPVVKKKTGNSVPVIPPNGRFKLKTESENNVYINKDGDAVPENKNNQKPTK